MEEKMLLKMKKMMGDMSTLSDVEKEAKMRVMQALRDDMSDLLKGKLKGLKKITVASNTEEGLKKGLQKAEEILSKKCVECEGEGCPKCEPEAKLEDKKEMLKTEKDMETQDEKLEEDAEEETEEEMEEDMDVTAIEKKIKELEKLKERKLKGL